MRKSGGAFASTGGKISVRDNSFSADDPDEPGEPGDPGDPGEFGEEEEFEEEYEDEEEPVEDQRARTGGMSRTAGGISEF
mmetsp:Transcript_32843/g.50192  ORF Transcript_32843/g.50192 Transcript_32843/m.50192 type:complete len:80 (+) Transcript_32843:1278-1517(+)